MELPGIGQPLHEAEFAQLAQELVDDTAPRVFALLAEDGDHQDGSVAGWGLAFDNRAVLIDRSGRRLIMVCSSADSARRKLARLGPVRLIWPQQPAD